MKLDDLKCAILSEILSEGMFDFLRQRNETDPEEDSFRRTTVRRLSNRVGREQRQLVDDYLKFMYGTGAYNDPRDAERTIQAIQNSPDDVADSVLHALSQPGAREYLANVADASNSRNLQKS